MHNHILYLASGSSRRFGSNKLLHKLEGRPMFRYGLETLEKVTKNRKDCTVTVVSRYEPIRRAALELGFLAVDSPDSEKGAAHTIRAGIQSLGQLREEDFLLFLVADQPWLTAASLENLLAQARPGTVGASLCWKERPGNPTLFSARLVPELLSLEGDRGGRAVLKKHPCVFVSAGSEKELQDLDFPE